MPLLIATIAITDEPGDNFSPILEWLRTANLSFENPCTHLITSIVAGQGQVAVTREEVMEAAVERRPMNVQMWFPEGGDLFVAWDEREVSVFLDGKSIEQMETVIANIVKCYLSLVKTIAAEWKICLGSEDVV